MKIVIAPDSFKHTMSAAQVCAVMARAVRDVFPEAEVISLPLGDGGEGTLEALKASTGAVTVPIKVTGPLFEEVETSYCITPDGTALIEMALICGLTMVERPNPSITTTFGVGQAILSALNNGCRKCILCIGGSSTNDAGIGALTALGVRFLDDDGAIVHPVGGQLARINRIDYGSIDLRLAECEIILACDVDNPLYGERGAAFIFAPQKGADGKMVSELDAGLRHFAETIRDFLGIDIANTPGSGAAGGIGAGLSAFCNVTYRKGIELTLETVGFDEAIRGADYIFTGEGCTDMQTLMGKVPMGVASRAKMQNIPVIILSGSVKGDVDRQLHKMGVLGVFSAVRMPMSFEDIVPMCVDWLYAAGVNICKLLK